MSAAGTDTWNATPIRVTREDLDHLPPLEAALAWYLVKKGTGDIVLIEDVKP
ncbi:MAG: hypothetical protein NTY71_02450 [Methanoregula sp.]|nr:hypothetical protein [Methanoregula sp.]